MVARAAISGSGGVIIGQPADTFAAMVAMTEWGTIST